MKKMLAALAIILGVLIIVFIALLAMGVVSSIYSSFYPSNKTVTSSSVIGRCGLPTYSLLLVKSVLPYDKGTDPLLAAMNSYHKSDFKKLLDTGTDPNGTDPSTSPLHAAISSCDLWFAQQLLSHGADSDGEKYGTNNTEVRARQSPMTAAVLNSDEGAVNLLLLSGADVNGAPGNDPPAEVAAEANNYEMVLFLLNKGANPFAYTQQGFTIGFWANRTIQLFPNNTVAQEVIDTLKADGYPWPPLDGKGTLAAVAAGTWPPKK